MDGNTSKLSSKEENKVTKKKFGEIVGKKRKEQEKDTGKNDQERKRRRMQAKIA